MFIWRYYGNPFGVNNERTYLDNAFDAVDGAAEEAFEFGVVVGVVRVTDAHEQNVGRKTRKQNGRTFRLQFQDQILVAKI